MTGNDIRKQYIVDKDLLKAIDNTLTLLEQADENTLRQIRRTIDWDACIRVWETGSIAIGALVETVAVITKIENRDRIIKCIYKGKHEGLYRICTLRRGLRNMGKVVCH